MKKWLLLVLLAAAMAIAGCGNKAADDKGNSPVEDRRTAVDTDSGNDGPDDSGKDTAANADPHAEQEPDGEPGPDSDSALDSEPDGTGPLPDLTFAEAFGGMKFDTPVGIRHAGDGSGKLYVVEQPGRIIVLSGHADRPNKKVFLDLTDKVHDEGWEQGLLGLAFHPEYDKNGKFYVNYTTRSTTVIEEYQRSADDPDQADKRSARKLLEFSQPYRNHNGGELAFGPDGYLYIGSGDGGSSGDPQGNGQNRKTLLGKILRIDVDHAEGDLAYAIPPDNPFAGNKEGFREEIYAYGLRNPWRFSFDPKTGWLWAADVGQDKIEEIDIIESGGNYGWNIMEGNSCFKPANNCNTEGLIRPIWQYEAGKGGASVTGGYVYRGKAIPELRGRYVFADFMDGRMWALRYDGEAAEAEEIKMSKTWQGITSFGTDEDGEIYACMYDGTIVKLVSQ